MENANLGLAIQRSKAHRSGGWREHYAMENGTEMRCTFGGHDCLRYVYGEDDEYQDANGATWDIDAGKWIG